LIKNEPGSATLVHRVVRIGISYFTILGSRHRHFTAWELHLHHQDDKIDFLPDPSSSIGIHRSWNSRALAIPDVSNKTDVKSNRSPWKHLDVANSVASNSIDESKRHRPIYEHWIAPLAWTFSDYTTRSHVVIASSMYLDFHRGPLAKNTSNEPMRQTPFLHVAGSRLPQESVDNP
jgi:hypothetical protein